MKLVRNISLMAWVLGISIGVLPIADLAVTYAQETSAKPNQQRLLELRQKIQEAKHRKLRKSLALDEQTAPKFFEKYSVAERDIQELSKQRNEELRKLYSMMQGAGKDGDVDPAMARVRELNQKIQERQLRLDSELKPILSPRQRARLLAFDQEFNRKVRERVIEQRKKRREDGRIGPGRRPGARDQDGEIKERGRGGKGPKKGRPRGPK